MTWIDDAGRVSRPVDNGTVRLHGLWVHENDVPSLSDLAEEAA